MTSLLTISDTTLRDGVQMSGARLSVQGKVRIAEKLESIGVRSLEIGFPASGAREIQEMRAIAKTVRRSMLLALCRTVERDIDAARSVFDSVARIRCGVNLFLATSPIHRDRKLRMTRKELLRSITRAVAYARKYFTAVSFSAEDASRTEPEFLLEVYKSAIGAGVTTIGYPDTLGILTPEAAYDAIARIRNSLDAQGTRVAVHFHNDLGLATANSLAAIKAGADVVQCTVNGMGERAGNAPLEEVAVALMLHPRTYGRVPKIDTTKLTAVSQLVARETGIGIPVNKPIVGRNVFSSAAGLHQDGLLKDPRTYLPFSPQLVGIDTVELVLGRQSGRAAAAAYLAARGESATRESVDSLVSELKTGNCGRIQRRVLVNVG
ncbi:MAG TPA: 2-isopropylmalate synthase [Bryobacteraceae bacterium]|nr:2-isopropylmalate synthase [Bryobacteraceae bacterium]